MAAHAAMIGLSVVHRPEDILLLEKGPHLVEALSVLDDILRRMESHQNKKRARLRSLRLSALT